MSRRESEGNMKRLDFTTIILIILVTLAMSCIALAFRPVILKMEKQQEIDQELEKFQETTEAIQLEMENTPVPSPEATAVPEIVPYSDLYTDILRYNLHLFSSRQAELNSKSAYEHSSFVLTDYGLPDEIFGVITIPKIDVEMPLYLGASELNMANGAAVLAQTSIPIGGLDTNAVVAGHRGYSGYKYFKDIDQLEIGDEVIIKNLWRELHYRVVDIQVVLPNGVESILIQPGKELITLLSCHPYASGGKYRYLVIFSVNESKILNWKIICSWRFSIACCK